MPKHLPKLLVLAAIFLVAPVKANPEPAQNTSECPYARAAAAEAAADGPTTLTIETPVPEGSLLGGSDHASSVFLP
jgi:hypothetical protein